MLYSFLKMYSLFLIKIQYSLEIIYFYVVYFKKRVQVIKRIYLKTKFLRLRGIRFKLGLLCKATGRVLNSFFLKKGIIPLFIKKWVLSLVIMSNLLLTRMRNLSVFYLKQVKALLITTRLLSDDYYLKQLIIFRSKRK